MPKVYLTAGHHFKDSGAIGSGFKENELTIELKDLVTSILKSKNVEVWNDYDGDTLGTVIKKINASGVSSKDILLEIHFDSATRLASGTTALVADNARNRSRFFAEDLSTGISKIMGITDRGVKSEKDSNRGKLGILHTAASSVLIEICFINNTDDMLKYTVNKLEIAETIANVIIKHLYA